MALTFAEVRSRNLLRTLLNSERGAEDCIYLASGGAARTVRCLIHSAISNLRSNPEEVFNLDQIDCRFSKDPAATDGGVVLGGVERPQLGDGLIRAGEDRNRAYGFAFVIEEAHDSWLCRFERRLTRQIGTQQTRQ
jgi:hypothetical protein